jgi:hypothetical protein
MRLLPEHPVTRAIAAAWALICVACLLLTLLQADLYANERRALRLLVPVYFLALPSAHLAFAAIAKTKLALYLNAGMEPALPVEAAALWTLTVALGYAQWFIALPWLAQRFRRLLSMDSGKPDAPYVRPKADVNNTMTIRRP